MAKFRTEFKPPLSVVRSNYSKRIKDLKNLKNVYTKISIFLDRWVQLNFRSEGGKVGKWKKLSGGGRYVGKGNNRRFDPSAKVLQDTGRLRASFLPFANNKDAGIGSDLPYSMTHEKGDGVPKRRMLPTKKDVMPDVVKIVEKHISKSLKNDKL